MCEVVEWFVTGAPPSPPSSHWLETKTLVGPLPSPFNQRRPPPLPRSHDILSIRPLRLSLASLLRRPQSLWSVALPSRRWEGGGEVRPGPCAAGEEELEEGGASLWADLRVQVVAAVTLHQVRHFTPTGPLPFLVFFLPLIRSIDLVQPQNRTDCRFRLQLTWLLHTMFTWNLYNSWWTALYFFFLPFLNQQCLAINNLFNQSVN